MSHQNKKNVIGYMYETADVHSYANVFGNLKPWEIDPWQEASLSWKETSYIHTGISNFGLRLKGPEAQEFLRYASVNKVEPWKLNRGKHLVFCDEKGLIASHALTNRFAEDEFIIYAANPLQVFKLLKEKQYDLELTMPDFFIYQMSGPLSLTIIEKAIGQDLHDIKFLENRKVHWKTLGINVEVQRIGMSGTLAYEVKGEGRLGPDVYDALYNAGKPLGLKRLGWRTYMLNHTEGGYPQGNGSFAYSVDYDPILTPHLSDSHNIGSVDPKDNRARMRTPYEVDWGWMIDYEKGDFVGKDSLLEERKHPKRRITTLEWNVDDLVDIYRSLYEEGEEPYRYIEYPIGYLQPNGANADRVLDKNGNLVGVSSIVAYSNYYRKTISQCIMDIDQIEEGKEVIVQWGDYGHRIKDVRATIARYPYSLLMENKDYDITSVPKGNEL
ncbi:MAG: aminomethyl transferase family protein [Tissierellia bacterium]|nr:aminomethyl transferase family protein [Tissierellia bacterium]